MPSNLEYCRGILKELKAQGLGAVCLCAGSRNSPVVVELLKDKSLENFHFFEERSAAFFALGLARRRGGPVLVVTTSGTAAAELLPAVIEAHYSRVPLILLTADRPRHYRGTGAPQSIEQKGLFTPYVSKALDLECGEAWTDLQGWDRQSPLHLNLCLAEPLLGDPVAARPPAEAVKKLTQSSAAAAELKKFLSDFKRPLVIVAGLLPAEAQRVLPFLSKLQAPIWAEATSQLREEASLKHLIVRSGERVLKYANFDSLLRIGSVPQCRFWRDLEHNSTPLLSLSTLPFAGTSRGTLIVEKDLGNFLASMDTPAKNNFEEFFTLDKRIYEAKLALFAEESRSEAALFHSLSRLIPERARIFLGNSMPIREWDLAAVWKAKNFVIGASRGANGIDGQISTFLGWLDPAESAENWGIFGDLTSLYDLSAPWAMRQMPETTSLNIVVVNNNGGRIFARLKHLKKHIPTDIREKYFENAHNVDFAAWAKLWNLGYEKWEKIPPQLPGARQSILELCPDLESSERFWRQYEKIFEEIC